MSAKYSINLLQADLFPEKTLLTLSRVVAVWFTVLLLMILWSVFTNYQQQSLTVKHNALRKINNEQSELVKDLERKLTVREVDAKLRDKLATIKLLMKHKRAIHVKLTDTNRTFVTGFADAMDELSSMHHPDIRLQAININHDDMSFIGLARVPEAVPAWLAGFERSKLLSGKSFIHFKISKNKENITEFAVSSKVSEGAKL